MAWMLSVGDGGNIFHNSSSEKFKTLWENCKSLGAELGCYSITHVSKQITYSVFHWLFSEFDNGDRFKY